MAGDRSLRQSLGAQHHRVSFAGKENIPPVDQKRKASIAGLFDRPRQPRNQQSQKSRAPLQPIDGLFPSVGDGGPDIFRQIKKAKLKHDVHSEQDFISKNDEVLRRIFARLDGVDTEGYPLEDGELPTKADWNKLQKQYRTLTRPIEDDELTLQTKQADGTITHKHVLVSESLDQFTAVMIEKRKEFMKARQGMYKIDDEIDAIHQDIVQQKDPAYQQAKDTLAAQQAHQQKKLDKLKEVHAKEVESLKEKQKAAARKKNAEYNAVFQNMLANVGDDD